MDHCMPQAYEVSKQILGPQEGLLLYLLCYPREIKTLLLLLLL